MSDRNYYVLCDDNCRFPGMTQEQVLAAIAAATGKTVPDVDDAFITKVKEMNARGSLSFWVGTTAQYNVIVAENKVEKDCFYILTDDTFGADVAAAISKMQNVVASAETTVNAVNRTVTDMKNGVVIYPKTNAPILYNTALNDLEELIDVSGIENFNFVRVLAGTSINEDQCSYVLCTVRQGNTNQFYIEGAGTGNGNKATATDTINIRIAGYRYENERYLSANTSTEEFGQIKNGAYVGTIGSVAIFEIVGIM